MTEARSTPQTEGPFGRVVSGTVLTAGSYALTQVLRLGSNLVLTRLLFPEAFGLMALVSVVLVGLAMFSDMGIGPAINQSPKGDEPAFLDTAFSINVLRGAVLWLLTCAAAWPMALAYNAPDLMLLLPVAGLTLLIAGFNPTRIDTANRHLLLGRVTLLDLIAQIMGIAAIVLLAFILVSVWALVWGAIIGALAKLTLMHLFLPGRANRFGWQREAVRDLIHFGKWIFLSTACGFALSQGDKAILGAYLPLDQLGIYNIGYFLASFPVLLAGAVSGRIMIPIYRDRHPAASGQNAARLRKLRFALTGSVLLLLALIGVLAMPLVSLLYDARYIGAAQIVAALSIALMPQVVGMTYDQSALAAGNSKGYFAVMALRALVQTLAFVAGVHFGGMIGALLALGLAGLITHPLIVLLARRHQAWDAAHDLISFLGAAMLAFAVVQSNMFDTVAGLFN